LDGNEYFAPAATFARRMFLEGSALPAIRAGPTVPVIIVGIGYPTDEYPEILRRRAFDLTPSPSAQPADAGKYGGADIFFQVLDAELKPFVSAHYRVDGARQFIYGHSFGGLAILHLAFRTPGQFTGYAVSSPSIWWHQYQILTEEAAFAGRASTGCSPLRLL